MTPFPSSLFTRNNAVSKGKISFGLVFFAYEPIRRVILAFLTNLILTPPYTIFTDCKKLVLVLPPLAPSSAGPPLVHGAWE